MKRWPTIDFFAQFGHVAYSALIIYLALFRQISLLLYFFVVCICLYYMIAVRRIWIRARFNSMASGLGQQTDITMATLITKQYKREKFYEFLSLRSKLWNLQFSVYIICTCIGYPTELLYKLSRRQNASEETKRDLGWY
jgi:hypothetical protein